MSPDMHFYTSTMDSFGLKLSEFWMGFWFSVWNKVYCLHKHKIFSSFVLEYRIDEQISHHPICKLLCVWSSEPLKKRLMFSMQRSWSQKQPSHFSGYFWNWVHACDSDVSFTNNSFILKKYLKKRLRLGISQYQKCSSKFLIANLRPWSKKKQNENKIKIK